MLDSITQPLQGYRGTRYVPLRDGAPISRRRVLRDWQADEAFRTFFISVLAQAPYPAYRWETPAMSLAIADSDFEFVLLDCPELDRPPDPNAFAEQMERSSSRRIAAFANLGNDAWMLVPRPAAPQAAYVHLAAFVRQAPASQVHELWQTLGAEAEARLSDAPQWLSTAGMGVAWLHVRIDRRPKYYGYAQYREPR